MEQRTADGRQATARGRVRLVVRPQTRPAVPADDWNRFGRQHFISRSEFERWRNNRSWIKDWSWWTWPLRFIKWLFS